MNEAGNRIAKRAFRVVVAALLLGALGYVSLRIGAVGAALFTPERPSSASEFMAGDDFRAPTRSMLAVNERPATAYAVPRYAPVSKVNTLQYRMNRVLVREEQWQARSAPWEIIDYYTRYFIAGLWDDVTDEQFGLTRNEDDPTCSSHHESFEDWAERYHHTRSHHIAVRRGNRSIRVSVEPGERGVSAVRVLWAETPDIKQFADGLARGLRESAPGGGQTMWVIDEDCRDCPEPELRVVRFSGNVREAERRLADDFANDGWSRRMDFAAHAHAADMAVWGKGDQIRLVSLAPEPRGTGTDALIMTVKD